MVRAAGLERPRAGGSRGARGHDIVNQEHAPPLDGLAAGWPNLHRALHRLLPRGG